jgi:hypothetical protein
MKCVVAFSNHDGIVPILSKRKMFFNLLQQKKWKENESEVKVQTIERDRNHTNLKIALTNRACDMIFGRGVGSVISFIQVFTVT